MKEAKSLNCNEFSLKTDGWVWDYPKLKGIFGKAGKGGQRGPHKTKFFAAEETDFFISDLLSQREGHPQRRSWLLPISAAQLEKNLGNPSFPFGPYFICKSLGLFLGKGLNPC